MAASNPINKIVKGVKGLIYALPALLQLIPMYATSIDKGIKMIDTGKVFENKDVAKLAGAVRRGDVEQIKLLVQAGVNPDAKSIDGAVLEKEITLLEWAILCQNKKGFAALLEAGADPLTDKGSSSDSPLLHFTAMINDPDYLAILLKHGVDPNLRDVRNGDTALFEAIDKPKHVQLLLHAGADIHIKDNFGRTVLFSAGIYTVEKLLGMGVDPTVKDNHENSFQWSFFRHPPENIVGEQGRKIRQRVRKWLRQHDIEVEG